MRGHANAEAFSNELASLKRGGCNVLVVSDAAGREPACERLLGAPELDRSHVFLTTSSDVSTVLDRHRPRRTDPSSLGVVDATADADTRAAAAASGSTAATPSGPSVGDAWHEPVASHTDFDALADATRRALDRVATDADVPAEVRFCLDGLDPLFDAVERGDTSEKSLFRFLHVLTGLVRDTDGMGHFHVSEAAADHHVATVEPLFDATLFIETNETGDVRQRWRLHDSGRVTDWFEF